MDDDTAFRSFITHGELLRDVADLVIWGVKGMGEISGKIWIRKVGKPEGGGRISDRYWAVLGRFTSGQRAMVMQWPAIRGVNGYHYVEKVSVEYRTSEHQTV